ncbi:PspC domain-containing protein [Natronogracilivirga saccharolytica]|uniref:PspC domain-containing protein n=1 Tax=Natronogracilivirga saccharolytica TaxID=2812953 RepID=A0A8J7RTI1_9BACT|nr:PspC domain-containing protein [Natronogracilivirga saccharolytica]MBP3193604.1 PspC domain-containing protein [Natronogracilivirga saccharolytica]
MTKRLTKSATDSILFGVCGGIAEYFGWDSTLVRVIFIVATIFSFSSFALLYLVLAVIMPR